MRDLLFKCPNCAASLAFSRELAGKALSCPSCKGRIAVPIPDASFNCPTCNAELHVRSDATGEFECPACKGAIIIEGEEPSDAIHPPSQSEALPVEADDKDRPIPFSFPCPSCGKQMEVVAEGNNPGTLMQCPNCPAQAVVPPPPDRAFPVLQECFFGVCLGEPRVATLARAAVQGVRPYIDAPRIGDLTPTTIEFNRPLDGTSEACHLSVSYSFYDLKAEKLDVEFDQATKPTDFQALQDMLSAKHGPGRTTDEQYPKGSLGRKTIERVLTIEWNPTISGEQIGVSLRREFQKDKAKPDEVSLSCHYKALHAQSALAGQWERFGFRLSFPCFACSMDAVASVWDRPGIPFICPHCGKDAMVPPLPDRIFPVLEPCLFGVYLGESVAAVCDRAEAKGQNPTWIGTGKRRMYLGRPIDTTAIPCALEIDFSFYNFSVESLKVQFMGPRSEYDSLLEMLTAKYGDGAQMWDSRDEEEPKEDDRELPLDYFLKKTWQASISGETVGIRLLGQFPKHTCAGTEMERFLYRKRNLVELPDGKPRLSLSYEYDGLATQSSHAEGERSEVLRAARRDARVAGLKSQLPHV